MDYCLAKVALLPSPLERQGSDWRHLALGRLCRRSRRDQKGVRSLGRVSATVGQAVFLMGPWAGVVLSRTRADTSCCAWICSYRMYSGPSSRARQSSLRSSYGDEDEHPRDYERSFHD